MRFCDISGHDNVKHSLRSLIESGRIPHAVMLSGPSGIGKMLLARAFVQYLHCENRSAGEPCGHCPSCRQHQNLMNPDLHFVFPVIKTSKPKRSISDDYIEEWKNMLEKDPFMSYSLWISMLVAENKQPTIYADEADAIAAKAILSPMQEKIKVFIIWLPEKMQLAAANKLLKLIEEPYPDTMFVLVSNDPGAVLPTVFSRVQRFNMLPLPDETVAQRLVEHGLPEEEARGVAALAEGSLGEAIQLCTFHEENHVFESLFREIMRCAFARKVGTLRVRADELSSMGREKLRRFLSYCARMVRENFIYNLRMPQLSLMTPDEEQFSYRFAPFIHHANVEDMMREFARAENDIARNANPKIVLFSLFLALCSLIRTRKA